MSNQKVLFGLLAKMVGQANILTIPRIFIDICNRDHKAALFISQCIYWSDKTSRDDGFFYKSMKEWEDELALTRDEIDRIREVHSRFIETKLKRAHGVPTLHWRVNQDEIIKAVEELLDDPDLPESDKSDLRDSHKTLTETTTETTQIVTAASGVGSDINDSAKYVDSARNLPVKSLQSHRLTKRVLPDKKTLFARGMTATYVEPGEEFEDSSHLRRTARPKWQYPKTELCKRALDACGRDYFNDKDERSRWIAIEKAMIPLDERGLARYPAEWVEAIIAWAKKKNYVHERALRPGVAIQFWALLNTIDNEERKKEFVYRMLNHPDQLAKIREDAGIEVGDDEMPYFLSDEEIERELDRQEAEAIARL